MQAIDGQGYRLAELTGSLATDAGLSLLACAVLLPLVLHWLRRDLRVEVALEPAAG